jgi:hypothetical protein
MKGFYDKNGKEVDFFDQAELVYEINCPYLPINELWAS